LSVCKVCQLLNINRNKYYYIKRKGDTEEEISKVEKKVLALYNKHNGNYGRRRLKRELDIQISEAKIAKILKKHNLTAKSGRKRVGKNIYTEKEKYLFDNKIKALDKSNEKIWSADITEMRYDKGRLFVSGIIDVNTKVVHLTISERPNSELVIQNILKALKEQEKPKYYHTDRGSAYCSREMRELLNTLEIEHSMSAPCRPCENQYIESFWKTIKTEMGKTKNMSKEDLIMAIEYYEYYYNNERLHSSIGYAYPMEYLKQANIQSCH